MMRESFLSLFHVWETKNLQDERFCPVHGGGHVKAKELSPTLQHVLLQILSRMSPQPALAGDQDKV